MKVSPARFDDERAAMAAGGVSLSIPACDAKARVTASTCVFLGSAYVGVASGHLVNEC